MTLSLTPDQVDQLNQLGISTNTTSKSIETQSNDIKSIHVSPLELGKIDRPSIVSTQSTRVLNKVFPLLSISGISIISFGGLLLLKSKNQESLLTPQTNPIQNPQSEVIPTQVPKSIQHYLLTSQQQFTQALQTQSSDPNQTIALVNQSILEATSAIKEFPEDSRGYEQRAHIYQSLLESQPQLLDQAIADYRTAQKLNPNSPEVTRSLASLYGRKGDAQSVINYLAQTVSLEPTKAQNFYDLARIQQQAGFLPQALQTYTRLLTLVSDPSQKQQVESEAKAITQLLSQSPTSTSPSTSEITPVTLKTPSKTEGPLLQASTNTGPIIAAPETSKDLQVTSLTDSNALSGNAILEADLTSITIPNSNLKPTSQVYLSIVSGGKNQTLQLLSKSKDSFTVGLDSPIAEPITFKWWIIND